MSFWVQVAISVVILFWGLVEVIAYKSIDDANQLRRIMGEKLLRYSTSGQLVTILYLVVTIFWTCYLFLG